MTDRLAHLLHDEATALEIPPVATDRILTQGRGIQRRRRTTIATAFAAVAVLVVGVAVTAVVGGRGDKIEPAGPADQKAYLEKGAWAIGDEVHIGNHVATVPYVSHLAYTSVGVLAWSVHITKKTTRENVTSVTTLVTPDGTTHPLDYPGIASLGAAPGSDPASPYIAYARASAGSKNSDLVVINLLTGRETVVRSPAAQDDDFAGERVDLDGDVAIYRGSNDERVQVNWRTGQQLPIADDHGIIVMNGYQHGRGVASYMGEGRWEVWSAVDDRLMLTVTVRSEAYDVGASLSPDGKHLAVPIGEKGMRVYSVDTGDFVLLGGDRDVGDYGWSPDGHLIGKKYAEQESEVEICDPGTGTCTGTGIKITPRLTLVRGAEALPV